MTSTSVPNGRAIHAIGARAGSCEALPELQQGASDPGFHRPERHVETPGQLAMGETVRIGKQDRLLAGRIEPVEAAPESAVVREAQDQGLGVLLLADETE